MITLCPITRPIAFAIAATMLLGATAVPAAGQCDAESLENPYGTEPYGLVEWQGHYYDAGWFHLRRRAVEGGEWNDVGGGISGGGGYTLAESMLPWNGRLVVGGAFTTAGGLAARNIVAWNGASFEPLGNGLNDEVLSLVEWNGRLVAGGAFTASGDGAVTLLRVAVYDDKADAWQPLGRASMTCRRATAPGQSGNSASTRASCTRPDASGDLAGPRSTASPDSTKHRTHGDRLEAASRA